MALGERSERHTEPEAGGEAFLANKVKILSRSVHPRFCAVKVRMFRQMLQVCLAEQTGIKSVAQANTEFGTYSIRYWLRNDAVNLTNTER